MSKTSKKVYLSSLRLKELCAPLCSFDALEVSADLESVSSVEQEDILVIESLNDIDKRFNTIILIANDVDSKECITQGITACLSEDLLEHTIGKTYFKRLLGISSSLSLEVQFEDEGVSFRNFRLTGPENQGYYSDIIAKEIRKTQIHPVIPRIYFDSLMTYLHELNKKSKISFPIEVDFGAFKDAFVVQVHCSMRDLTRDQILSSFGDYNLMNPMKGILSLISNQVDVLDIYSLERSSRLVMTAVWFNQEFKSTVNLSSSVLIHHVENFEPSQYQPSKESLSWAGESSQNFESQAIQKIEGLKLEEMARMVIGGSVTEEEVANWINGVSIDEDEIQRVKGRIDEDDTFVRIKEGQELSAEEKWKFKKMAMIASLKDKITIKGGLESEEELKQVIKDHLGIAEEKLDDVVIAKKAPPADESDLWVDQRTDDQRVHHEVLKRDAQIHKMKKLIDRMKDELNGKTKTESGSNLSDEYLEQVKESHDRLLKNKDKKIESLIKRNEELVQERLNKNLSDSERTAFETLKKDYDKLQDQLDMANQRLTQMSENHDEKVKGQTERLSREVEQYKKQNKTAHEIMQKFKREKQKLEEELSLLRSDEIGLKAKVQDFQKDQSSSGQGLEKDLDELKLALQEEKDKGRALEDELKQAQIALKKFEQKAKFLQAQLETAQKAAAGATQVRGSMGNGTKGSTHKEAQLSKLVESLKIAEQKLNADLTAKKDEANKLKSENTALNNKLVELERRVQKYEKKAA
jgi:hypothetical protein